MQSSGCSNSALASALGWPGWRWLGDDFESRIEDLEHLQVTNLSQEAINPRAWRPETAGVTGSPKKSHALVAPYPRGTGGTYRSVLSVRALGFSLDHGLERGHPLAQLFVVVAGLRGHLLDRLEFLAGDDIHRREDDATALATGAARTRLSNAGRLVRCFGSAA